MVRPDVLTIPTKANLRTLWSHFACPKDGTWETFALNSNPDHLIQVDEQNGKWAPYDLATRKRGDVRDMA